MIRDHCFTEEWLDKFKGQASHKRVDKIILEKMIYALHLLERLRANDLEFVFKGGTSLLLLLSKANRFSIDIDIICQTERKALETILDKVVASSRFTQWKLDEHRSYQEGIPKAHYKFYFDSNKAGSGTILLDILKEGSIYPQQTQCPIDTKWIEMEEETLVTVPTVDAITGDKLTAFAPNTIGIPYFKGKDQRSFSMEICKQLFDLSLLFEEVRSLEIVAASFTAFAQREMEYRKQALTPTDVLWDTINTCSIISRRGRGTKEEEVKFSELQKGILAFGTGFLMEGRFRIDEAIPAASRVAHLAAKLLINDFSPIAKYKGQDIKALNIQNPDWNALNRLKRQPDKSSFYYWYHTANLLTRGKV